jgi:hypothetical protein
MAEIESRPKKKGFGDKFLETQLQVAETEREARVGAVQATAGFASGMATTVAGGIEGGYKAAGSPLSHITGGGDQFGSDEALAKADAAIKKWQDKGYAPPEGSAGAEVLERNPLALAFQGLKKVGDSWGDWALQKWPNNPEIAALFATTPEGVAIIFGPKAGRVGRAGMRGTRAAVTKYRNTNWWRMKNIAEREATMTTVTQVMDMKNPATGKNYTLGQALKKASDQESVAAARKHQFREHHRTGEPRTAAVDATIDIPVTPLRKGLPSPQKQLTDARGETGRYLTHEPGMKIEYKGRVDAAGGDFVLKGPNEAAARIAQLERVKAGLPDVHQARIQERGNNECRAYFCWKAH